VTPSVKALQALQALRDDYVRVVAERDKLREELADIKKDRLRKHDDANQDAQHAPLPWETKIEVGRDEDRVSFYVEASDGTVVSQNLTRANAELIVGSANVCRTLRQYVEGKSKNSSFLAAAQALLPRPQDSGGCLKLLAERISDSCSQRKQKK